MSCPHAASGKMLNFELAFCWLQDLSMWRTDYKEIKKQISDVLQSFILYSEQLKNNFLLYKDKILLVLFVLFVCLCEYILDNWIYAPQFMKVFASASLALDKFQGFYIVGERRHWLDNHLLPGISFLCRITRSLRDEGAIVCTMTSSNGNIFRVTGPFSETDKGSFGLQTVRRLLTIWLISSEIINFLCHKGNGNVYFASVPHSTELSL